MIKKIEERLSDPHVVLHSCIVSNMASHTVKMLWSLDKATMKTCPAL